MPFSFSLVPACTLFYFIIDYLSSFRNSKQWHTCRSLKATQLIVIFSGNTWHDFYQFNYYVSRLMTKPTMWPVGPAKTQISLSIRPVWSVFAVRMKKAWVLSYPLSTQWRLWSDWVDAQADLSRRWAHMPFVVLSWGGSCIIVIV